MTFNKKKVFLHAIIWLSYTAFWHFIWSPSWNDPWAFGVSIMYTLANVFGVYFTIYWLVPHTLNQRKWFLFFLGIITVTALAIGLNILLLWIYVGALDPDAFTSFYDTPEAWSSYVGSNSICIIIALAIQQFFNRKEEEKRRKEIEQEKLQAELKYLKNQLNPHFLFNALNSIYFLIKKNPDAAAEQLAGFSDLLRYQLYHSTAEKISLHQELENLEKFTALERLRLPEELVIDFKKTANINGETIAPFLLQPLVENAFKFVDRNNGFIKMDAILENGTFKFSVRNRYQQSDKKVKGEGGIGLTNVRRRLELLYPKTHVLQISKKENEYLVKLQIDLNA